MDGAADECRSTQMKLNLCYLRPSAFICGPFQSFFLRAAVGGAVAVGFGFSPRFENPKRIKGERYDTLLVFSDRWTVYVALDDADRVASTELLHDQNYP
jgi:hypothetical protein